MSINWMKNEHASFLPGMLIMNAEMFVNGYRVFMCEGAEIVLGSSLSSRPYKLGHK